MNDIEFALNKISDYRKFFRTKGAAYTAIFVANRFDGQKTDIDENGVSETAQYYNAAQMEDVRNAFDDIGVHFLHYASEETFMQDALKGNFADTAQMKYMVFPFAEGGRGSGRRALIPAFCSFLNIAFCGSPAHASSIARHKFHANAVLKNAGIRTPDTWMYFGKGQWAGERVPNRSTKVIVKPAYESNSIGVDADSSFVVEDGLQERLDSYVGRIKQAAVVQEFVSGYEIASPIVEIEGRIIALPCVGFETPRGRKMIGINRTFQDECIDNNVSYYKVEEIDSRYIESFQRASARAFSALEMSIMGRMDSRIDEDGRAWIFDTNESPPPLSTTSYAMSFGLLGLTYVDMVAAWLGATCHKFELT